jgi:hypothetical protein
MTDTPQQPLGGPRPKVRADDARGAPAGGGTITPAHGGRIGNPPFIPTDEQRLQVRAHAKVFPVHAEHYIATLIGISVSTLRRHFQDDLTLGRAEMLASVGAQMINRSLNADAETVKGDIDAQKFILARLGGWTTKVEVGDKARQPFGGEPVDLSRLSDRDLAEYGRLAAIAEGLDPDDVVGQRDDD